MKVCNFMNFLVLVSMRFELDLCRKMGNIHRKTCTSISTFKVIYGKAFLDCVKQCHRRRRCEIIMYKRRINECSLKDSMNITTLADGEPVCMFVNTSDWEKAVISPCDKNDCGITETCIESTEHSDRFECVISECPRPNSKSNAIIVSDVCDVGSRNVYKCDPTFVGVGNPYVSCKNDGTWSSTYFICGTNGTSPKLDAGIADLISITGAKWVTRTSITYACRPGFQGLGTTATSVMDENGIWNPSYVHCCNENITEFIWRKRCIAAFNGSFADSREDMANYCRELGGNLTGLVPSLAETLFVRHAFRWIFSSFTKEKLTDVLKECFRANNVTDVLNNVSKYTYQELIQEVVSRGFTTPQWHCGSTGWWAPNEPDGGGDEDCMVYANGTYGAFDVDCSSWIPKEKHDTGFVCHFRFPEI